MIVITGASDGLGKQLAKLYKEAGTTVVNVSRTESEYADHNILHNLREGDEIISAVKEIDEIDEKLEAIVNCVGIYTAEPLGEISEDEIKRAMSTNLKSQMLLISNLKKRIESDDTDILNVASTSGTKGEPDIPVYTASKWAVRGFTKSLQAEFRDKPNRIISFCPGGFVSRTAEKTTGEVLQNPDEWMKAEDIAVFIKQILDLPKNMEVSEVIINRKTAK